MYFVASSIIAPFTITLSVFCFGKWLKYILTFSDAFKSSVSVKSEYTPIILSSFTRSKS